MLPQFNWNSNWIIETDCVKWMRIVLLDYIFSIWRITSLALIFNAKFGAVYYRVRSLLSIYQCVQKGKSTKWERMPMKLNQIMLHSLRRQYQFLVSGQVDNNNSIQYTYKTIN